MARSSTPGKKGCHATWKLDLYAPTTDNGTSTRLPSVPGPLQCLHKETGGSEQQWLRLRTTGLSTKQPVASAQLSLLSRSSWKRCDIGAKRQSPKINPSKAQALWCTLNNKAVGQAMPGVSFKWRSHKTHEQSQIPRDPLRQNAYIRTRRRSNQQNSGTRKDCPR